jgi:hypothetical protein
LGFSYGGYLFGFGFFAVAFDKDGFGVVGEAAVVDFLDFYDFAGDGTMDWGTDAFG